MVLPRVIGGQVKIAGAARNAGAAAQAFEPLVLFERAAKLIGCVIEGVDAGAELFDQVFQQIGGNIGVAAKVAHDLALAFQVFQDISLELGAGADAQNLKQGDQRKVVIELVGALNERENPLKQLLKTQISANSFVKRVFVEDHAQFSSAGIIARTAAPIVPIRTRFETSPCLR